MLQVRNIPVTVLEYPNAKIALFISRSRGVEYKLDVHLFVRVTVSLICTNRTI